jgi:hypothetical protein
MRNGPQDDLAGLIRLDPRAERRAESPLHHRVDRLRLPSLTVLPLVLPEPPLHPPAPPAGRRLVARPPAGRRDDRADAVRPGRPVDPLGVEVGVGQQRPDPRPPHRLRKRPPELHQVGARAPAGHRREDQVAVAIDHEDDLGEVGVSPDGIGVSAAGPPLDVVAAGVPRLHAGAIDGRQRDAPLPDAVPQGALEDGVEHLPARDGGQEPHGGLLEGGIVRHRAQADLAAEFGIIGQVRRQPAVVEAQELLEHQAGQELGLGELLGAEPVPMRRQRLAGSVVGDLQDQARGFARNHISYYDARCTEVHGFSTEQARTPCFPGFGIHKERASKNL